MEGPSSLYAEINARLEQTRAERDAIQEARQALEQQIEQAIKGLPKRHNQTDAEMEAKLKELEFKHATTTWARNSDEIQMLKTIDKHKQLRKQLAGYNTAQDQIDELKRRRTSLSAELRMKEQSIVQMSNGLKKLRLAEKLRVDPASLIEDQIEVPETLIPRIVGKGGERVRQLEEQNGVSINVDRRSKPVCVTITGVSEGCSAVREILMLIINSVTEEMDLSDEKIVTLLQSRAALVQQYQEVFDVKMDVSRSTGKVKIIGLPDRVASARHAIEQLDADSQSVSYEPTLLGSLLGKGGSNIRSIEEDLGVRIDIMKESNTMSIKGPAESVRIATLQLTQFVENNREVEEAIEAERHLVMNVIVGQNAESIRDLQKECGVSIRRLDHPASENGDENKESHASTLTIVIKGPATKIGLARAQIEMLLDDCRAKTLQLVVPDYAIPSIIGKKGARIQALRQKFPGVSLDVDREANVVRIYAETEALREGAKQEILQIADENYNVDVAIDKDAAIGLKGTRGEQTRKAIGALSVRLDIDSDNELVHLRGPSTDVHTALGILNQYIDLNITREVPIDVEDQNVLVTGGDDSIVKKLQTSLDVVVYVSRIDQMVKIRGEKSKVDEAVEFLSKLLYGDETGQTVLVSVDPEVIGLLIGKQGSNLRKMEQDYTVKVDVLRSRGQIRLRGERPHVRQARQYLYKFMKDIKISTHEPCDEDQQELIRTNGGMAEIARAYGVQIESGADGFHIRGSVNDVWDAKSRLREYISGTASVKIHAVKDHIESLKSGPASSSIETLRNEHNVEILFDETPSAIIVSGPQISVYRAKMSLHRLMETMYPLYYGLHVLESRVLNDWGNVLMLDDLKYSTGAGAYVDRQCSCVRVYGDPHQVRAAVGMLEHLAQEYERTHVSVDIDKELLKEFMGRRGEIMKSLQKETGCQLHIDEEKMLVLIEAPDQETAVRAQTSVAARIEQVKRETKDVRVPEDVIGPLIGKAGARIRQLQESTGAKLDVDKIVNVIHIRGSVSAVEHATNEILAFIQQWQEQNYSKDLPIPPHLIGTLIGPRGSNIRELQSRNHVAITLHKDTGVATLKGSESDVREAISHIHTLLGPELQQFLDEHHTPAPATTTLAKVNGTLNGTGVPVDALSTGSANANPDPVSNFPTLPPGANPSAYANDANKPKRRRKKKPSVETQVEFEPTSHPHPVETEVGFNPVSNAHSDETKAEFDPIPNPNPSPSPDPYPTCQSDLTIAQAAATTTHTAETDTFTFMSPLSPNTVAPVPSKSVKVSQTQPNSAQQEPHPHMHTHTSAGQGRVGELLAMLLDPNPNSNHVSQVQPSTSTPQPEYYTSTSGFKIRL